MRNIFVKNLIISARKNPNIYLLTADLGFGAFDEFQKEFPDRFVNVGVAEANMIGVAAGLALVGKKVFVHSIAPFITFRCLEQIRNDICYHNLDVKLIGTGGGFNYGTQGFSHNPTEDLAVMRALPNMTVMCPADPTEAELVAQAMADYSGPTYIRLGKKGEKTVYQQTPNFSIGKGIVVKEGTDLTLLSTGNIIDAALETAENLHKHNLSTKIISLPCLKPLDSDIIKKSAQETKKIFTIEEHSEIGGLGGAVAETLLEENLSGIIFKKIALKDKCYLDIGTHRYLLEKNGLSAQQITEKILKSIQNNS